MKLGVACLLWLLLVCLTLPSTHGHVLGRSMEIRSKENRSKGLSPANTLPPTPSASPGSAALGGVRSCCHCAGAQVCLETSFATAFILLIPLPCSPGVRHPLTCGRNAPSLSMSSNPLTESLLFPRRSGHRPLVVHGPRDPAGGALREATSPGRGHPPWRAPAAGLCRPPPAPPPSPA